MVFSTVPQLGFTGAQRTTIDPTMNVLCIKPLEVEDEWVGLLVRPGGESMYIYFHLFLNPSEMTVLGDFKSKTPRG